MPAQDKYHNVVKRALIKDGWIITDEQVVLNSGRRHLFIDLSAAKHDGELIILIEIKGFEHSPSDMALLMDAIGQYRVYIAALTLLNDDRPLYLAVPIMAYNGVLSEPVGRRSLQDNQIKLLIFDPKAEAIVQWIPQP